MFNLLDIPLYDLSDENTFLGGAQPAKWKTRDFEQSLSDLLFQHGPTPDVEIERNIRIKRLYQRCENIASSLLHMPLPKDLFDHLVFFCTSKRRWIRWTQKQDHAEYMPELLPYDDPLFPELQDAEYLTIIHRELFGDAIARGDVSNDKMTDTYRLVSGFSTTLLRSYCWLRRFDIFRQTPEGLSYIESFPHPEGVIETYLCSESTTKNSHATQNWDSWFAAAVRLVRDALLTVDRMIRSLPREKFRERRRDTSGPQLSSLPRQAIVEKTQEMLKDLVTYMRPLLLPFIRKAGDAILREIKDYRAHMAAFRNVANAENSSEKVVIRYLDNGMSRDPWCAAVILTYKGHSVQCRRAHFEKYKKLFEKRIVVHHKRRTFEEYLFLMLLRYESVIYNSSHHTQGGNMHAAAPEKVFNFLRNSCFQIRGECFGSPNNCYFSLFCSGFPDVDIPFGSVGSFFDMVSLPPGAFEVGPPYTEEMLLATAEKADALIKDAVASKEQLSLFIFVPDWCNCKGLATLRASKYFQAEIEGPGKEHIYIIGAQHLVDRSNRYYSPPHATLCFVLQSPLAAEVNPITDEVCRSIQQGLLDGQGTCSQPARRKASSLQTPSPLDSLSIKTLLQSCNLRVTGSRTAQWYTVLSYGQVNLDDAAIRFYTEVETARTNDLKRRQGAGLWCKGKAPDSRPGFREVGKVAANTEFSWRTKPAKAPQKRDKEGFVRLREKQVVSDIVTATVDSHFENGIVSESTSCNALAPSVERRGSIVSVQRRGSNNVSLGGQLKGDTVGLQEMNADLQVTGSPYYKEKSTFLSISDPYTETFKKRLSEPVYLTTPERASYGLDGDYGKKLDGESKNPNFDTPENHWDSSFVTDAARFSNSPAEENRNATTQSYSTPVQQNFTWPFAGWPNSGQVTHYTLTPLNQCMPPVHPISFVPVRYDPALFEGVPNRNTGNQNTENAQDMNSLRSYSISSDYSNYPNYPIYSWNLQPDLQYNMIRQFEPAPPYFYVPLSDPPPSSAVSYVNYENVPQQRSDIPASQPVSLHAETAAPRDLANPSFLRE